MVLLVFQHFAEKNLWWLHRNVWNKREKKRSWQPRNFSVSSLFQEFFHLNRHLHGFFFWLLKKNRQQEKSVNMAKKKALKFYCKNTKFEWNLLKTINKDKDCMVGYRFSPSTIQTSVKFMTLWSNNFTLKLDKFPYFEMLFPAVSIDGY